MQRDPKWAGRFPSIPEIESELQENPLTDSDYGDSPWKVATSLLLGLINDDPIWGGEPVETAGTNSAPETDIVSTQSTDTDIDDRPWRPSADAELKAAVVKHYFGEELQRDQRNGGNGFFCSTSGVTRAVVYISKKHPRRFVIPSGFWGLAISAINYLQGGQSGYVLLVRRDGIYYAIRLEHLMLHLLTKFTLSEKFKDGTLRSDPFYCLSILDDHTLVRRNWRLDLSSCVRVFPYEHQAK